MSNFRLEWLHVNEATGDIIDVASVVKQTLTENTHHTFAPPGKTRRHGKKFVARIVYSGARCFVRAATPDAADVTGDSGFLFRHGMDANGRIQSEVRFEIEAGEVLQVLYADEGFNGNRYTEE